MEYKPTLEVKEKMLQELRQVVTDSEVTDEVEYDGSYCMENTYVEVWFVRGRHDFAIQVGYNIKTGEIMID